jgi:hypothetical protein
MNTATIARDDQAKAATTHARLMLSQLGTPTTTASRWLHTHARTLTEAIRSGTARSCPHLDSPAIAYAAVWSPGLLVCIRCVGLLNPNPHEDTTCDRCRHHADPIYLGVAAIGPVLLSYGLCRHCNTAVLNGWSQQEGGQAGTAPGRPKGLPARARSSGPPS